MSVEKNYFNCHKVSLHEREERIQGKKIRNEKKNKGKRECSVRCGKRCTGQMKW